MGESLTELTEKQVINLCDGRVLGCIEDFKVDICCGKITAIILPGESSFWGFKKCMDIIIPWEKICKLGKDAIIVDIGMLPPTEQDCGKKKR